MKQLHNHNIIYTFAYMAIGSFTPLIGPYLKTLGFSGSQIGVITAAGTTMAIFAVAFWGGIYNRAGQSGTDSVNQQNRRNEALLIAGLCIGAVCFAACLKAAAAFAFVLLFFVLVYFMQPPSISLIDAFAVEGEGERGDRDFGSKRAWGAVGFALGVFAGGRIAGTFSEGSIFYIYGVCFLITAAVLVLAAVRSSQTDTATARDANAKFPAADTNPTSVNTDPTTAEPSRRAGTYRELLHDKRVCQLLVCMFFMGGTNVANNTYFSFLYIEGGGTLAGVGIIMLLMVGSEVPFMMWCDRLARRFTLQKTILFAMILSSVRFIVYGFGLPWWLLAVLFFTQGAVNGIILVEFVRYISRIAPAGCKSLAVSAYYVIGSNISTIVCQFFGGLLLDSFGAAGVYMFFGLFNLAGTILYVLFGLHRE